ncbi:MAG: hypothetical protein AAF713_16870 [Pseudomonadota bacterium]
MPSDDIGMPNFQDFIEVIVSGDSASALQALDAAPELAVASAQCGAHRRRRRSAVDEQERVDAKGTSHARETGRGGSASAEARAEQRKILLLLEEPRSAGAQSQ